MNNVAFLLAAETGSGALTEAMKTALTNAFTAVSDDFMSVVAIALPVALGMVAVTMAVKYGVNFFKSVSK